MPGHPAIAAALWAVVPLPPASAFAQRAIHIVESRQVHLVCEASLYLAVTVANRAVFSVMLACSLAERAVDQRVRLKIDAVGPCGIDLPLSAAHWTSGVAVKTVSLAERAVNKPGGRTEFVVERQGRGGSQSSMPSGLLN